MERHPRRPAERQVRHRAEPGLGERAAAQGLRLQRAIHHLQRPVDRARRRNPPVQVAGRPQGPQARRRPGHQLRRPGEVGGRRQRAHLSGRPGIPAGPGQQTHRRGAQRPPADPLRHREAKLPVKPGAAVGPVANMAIPYRKNNPKFGEALNAALEKIKADGRFAKLSEKWFGLDVSQPPK
ncbi:transporter substrate-binding domain-containing protein [Pseudomonas aeruginosa]|uniref:transporter substrate-binding domain-containing protein n=1 Tax=Pseudomonas aeruginosa TaxID=287 RepID=UPI0039C5D9BE